VADGKRHLARELPTPSSCTATELDLKDIGAGGPSPPTAAAPSAASSDVVSNSTAASTHPEATGRAVSAASPLHHGLEVVTIRQHIPPIWQADV
jgi:hypothetical protein